MNVAHDQPRLHVALYQPQIPHNTGNVGRTCVAVDAKLWLVRPLAFRLDDQRLRRAGLDYWQHLDWEAVDDWLALQQRLPRRRYWCFTKHAERSHFDVAYREGDVLLFGSETQGLPAAIWQATPETALRIPMRGPVRSLNLSNAVAVAVYEAIRQLQRIPDAP